ncbi:MAG: hypothetical protein IGQ88_07360 [Gloeomargaritaceae cyanobacterium C42_A2020_066]|nr:hypothetical protein [Gloeomargaritaceae cyanobacterium C42_A2020_066]
MGRRRRWLALSVLLGLVMLGLAGGRPAVALAATLREVSPPALVAPLRDVLDQAQPQVTILEPQPGAVLESSQVDLSLAVEGVAAPTAGGLASRLVWVLDNQPGVPQPLASPRVHLDALLPGTHTLRVYLAYPWGESYKTPATYAQVTFHVLAPSGDHTPNPGRPPLLLASPQGAYGAEPIPLDWWVPLGATGGCPVRWTVNGVSFTPPLPGPLFLSGWQPGRNWVRLECLDGAGRPIPGEFTTVVREVTYQPGGEDDLDRLLRDELDLDTALTGLLKPAPEEPLPQEPKQSPQESDAEPDSLRFDLHTAIPDSDEDEDLDLDSPPPDEAFMPLPDDLPEVVTGMP